MLSERFKKKARFIRKNVFERVIAANMGHLGGTFSCVDIFVALYYTGILKYKAGEPRWEDRDRFVVGKGHACLALYEIWADLGILDSLRLEEFGSNGSSLSGQLNIDTPGAEYNSGSLGNAIGIANGMALAAKMDSKKYKTYALIGDGECAEGSIWESIMFAGEHSLNNLTGIIDRNRLGVTEVLVENEGTGNLEEKIKSCGWDCFVVDGHSIDDLLGTLSLMNDSKKPRMIVANTVKGKGISFMENGVKWHHSIPSESEIKIARKELRGNNL